MPPVLHYISMIPLLGCVVLTAIAASLPARSHQATCAGAREYTGFGHPAPVTIRGYSGDAMEPFIARDGHYLFFNNSNDPSVNTNLFYASRVDATTFAYQGEIRGVNTASLDAVPTMDRMGRFYFISTRSYATTRSTIYRGRFEDGRVSGVDLVPGPSTQQPGIVDFDVEVSPDGDALYFAEGAFGTAQGPTSADLVLAVRRGTRFARPAGGGHILANVNAGGLNYAAATAADERELFFTRIDPRHPADGPKVYRAYRQGATEPFGCPQRLRALTGYVEAPSLSLDGRTLYYHKRAGTRFLIYRVTR